MNIGILTFYKVNNFGANLQAVSTYYNLIKKGHTPILIHYESKDSLERKHKKHNVQSQEHLNFLERTVPNQTEICYNENDIAKIIQKYNIEAIIIGSDAVVQHHPLLARIRKGKRKPFYITKTLPETTFPNCFWGVGITESIPMAMMSVSSQNSEYKFFSKSLKEKMKKALERMKYISVRDEWTQKMFLAISSNLNIQVTPDPVFAFNQNAEQFIPTEEELRQKYSLPDRYVLVSLHSQSLSEQQLFKLKVGFEEKGLECVAFTMPTGIKFKHPFTKKIDIPLPPEDWYGLLKYASAYVGSNMHPIVVCLHNAVPCFSIDHWGTRDFWGHHKNDGSSKVNDILKIFDLQEYIVPIEEDHCPVNPSYIVDKIVSFPRQKVLAKSKDMNNIYEKMMEKIISCLINKSSK